MTDLSREAYIAGLREFADFLEDTTDDEVFFRPFWGTTIETWGSDKDQMIAAASYVGGWEKKYEGNSFSLSKRFGPITFRLSTERELVCEKRVVGTEKTIVKDYEHCPTIEKVVDIVEWDCHPLLKSSDAE